jgi:hypothetical protein
MLQRTLKTVQLLSDLYFSKSGILVLDRRQQNPTLSVSQILTLVERTCLRKSIENMDEVLLNNTCVVY